MLVEYTRSDRLPSLCASAIANTPLSLVTDPLCYINLTFVKRPFAKLYNVNLLGTFVGLAYCIQARFSQVNLKINRWRHDLWPHMHGWYNRNVQNNFEKASKVLPWDRTVLPWDGLREKRATNTLQKSCLFSTFFTFLQKCKRTGRNFDIWTIQKYQNAEIEFYVIFHIVNTSRGDYAETCVVEHSSLR